MLLYELIFVVYLYIVYYYPQVFEDILLSEINFLLVGEIFEHYSKNGTVVI